MKNKELAQKIKTLRKRKGFSQEDLAEKAGLGLRTIQRIENGETDPRGDSLKRLANVFEVSPDDIVDWTVQEDKGFLTNLNISALSFIFFPLLGILVPLIMWISKKDKIKNLNEIAKDLLNFQITWSMLLFIGYLGIILSTFYRMNLTGNINVGLISSQYIYHLIFIAIMYSYNFILIIVNAVRARNEKSVKYYPKINFLIK